MSSSTVAVVDTTDLTTLVGQGAEKGQYKKLVEKLFSTDLGNLRWGNVKNHTRDEFVSRYGTRKVAIQALLGGWINHYDLEFRKAPDDNDEMKRIVSNWTQTQAPLFAGSKRKRGNENATEEPDSKRPAADGDTKKTLTDEENKVEKIPPVVNCSWYVGSGQDNRPFYLRQCVMDVGEIILRHITVKEKRRERTILYVISGAAGIGKSWSINAFVTELLRNNLKVFFHSGSLGKAWIISKDGSMEAVDPDAIKIKSALRDDPDLVYVFDSPGSKEDAGNHAKAKLRQNVGVTLIFSSPKIKNYDYALSKSSGYKRVLNLPTWKKAAMLSATPKEKKEVVEACYCIWGGDMRACDKFIAIAAEKGLDEAKQSAVRELEEQII